MKPQTHSAREILTELENNGYIVGEYGDPSQVDQALKDLASLIRGEKKVSLGDFGDGWNEAIDHIANLIEGEPK